MVQASRLARVRLSPTPVPCFRSNTLGSSLVSIRRVWALPSKPPMSCAQAVERVLTVVTERRVAQVVGQARGVDDIRVAAQGPPELAADLGHLEASG